MAQRLLRTFIDQDLLDRNNVENMVVGILI
jgi:hypothetical protein